MQGVEENGMGLNGRGLNEMGWDRTDGYQYGSRIDTIHAGCRRVAYTYADQCHLFDWTLVYLSFLPLRSRILPPAPHFTSLPSLLPSYDSFSSSNHHYFLPLPFLSLPHLISLSSPYFPSTLPQHWPSPLVPTLCSPLKTSAL